MLNFTVGELKSFADKLPWEEILNQDFARVIKRMRTDDGKDWVLYWQIGIDGAVIEAITIGESEKMRVADSNEIQDLSKFEALKLFCFGGDYSRTKLSLESRFESDSGTAAHLARIIDGTRKQEILALTIDERFQLSDEWIDSVAQNRFDMESREAAKQQIREVLLGQDGPPVESIQMDVFITQEGVKTSYLVERLALWGSTVILFAQAKVGKTTLVFNLLRAIADLAPFLGVFRIAETIGKVGFLNFELTDELCRTWARRIPIENTERVVFWNLRGLNNPFRSREAMKEFATTVTPLEIETLIIDPLSGAFIGDSNNNDEVKRFFLMLEEFKVLSGVTHLFIMVHAGNDPSKPRGATTLRDHPDSIWSITKSKLGVRKFKAEGRDVSLEEGALIFDEATGLLRFVEEKTSGSEPVVLKDRILDYIRRNPGANARQIDAEFSGSKDRKSYARDALVAEGRVLLELGPRNSKLYSALSSPTVPNPFFDIGTVDVSSRSPLFIRGTESGEVDLPLHCSRCGFEPNVTSVEELESKGTFCPECTQMDWYLLMAMAE